MESCAIPKDEAARLAAVGRLGTLPPTTVTQLQRVARLASACLELPSAGVVLVGAYHEQWATRLGLPAADLPRWQSLAAGAVLRGQPQICADAAAAPEYKAHPWVAGPPHLRCVVAWPLRAPGGHVVAALVVADDVPRVMDGEARRQLADLAGLAEQAMAAACNPYVDDLSQLRAAAEAIATGQYTPAELDALSARPDPLGAMAASLQALAAAVQDREQRLQQVSYETIQRLVIAAEYKDRATASHIRRIGQYSRLLAEGLGLPRDERALLEAAGPMHDVGKIGVPDAVLQKHGGLSEREWSIVQRHCVIGAGILGGSDAELLQAGEVIALSHHERWDGSGYPNGAAGEDIPLWGRIVAVADVFDALISQRPYKPAFPTDKALRILRAGRGTHFDPALIDIFCERLDDVGAISAAVVSDPHA